VGLSFDHEDLCAAALRAYAIAQSMLSSAYAMRCCAQSIRDSSEYAELSIRDALMSSELSAYAMHCSELKATYRAPYAARMLSSAYSELSTLLSIRALIAPK
jgi:hypothetical protein